MEHIKNQDKNMSSRNEMIMRQFPPENSWEKNYRKIIELGQKLPKFNEQYKREKWLIKACQSPLWLKVDKSESGELLFTGDSDGLITKGLLAIFIEFYTKRNPEDILKDKPLFVKELELEQFLSSRRTNGLQALLDQILQYAKAFFVISESSKNIGQKS